MSDPQREGLALPGLDGTNPLGFLAALGVVAIIERTECRAGFEMSWQHTVGGWHPVIIGFRDVDELIAAICVALRLGEPPTQGNYYLHLGKNLSIDPGEFRTAEARAVSEASTVNRLSADTIASFGSSCVTHEKRPRIQPTELHFIFGSGHQHYLDTARKLLTSCTSSHVMEAIEGPWRYSDEKLSFRWDPEDAREYAYRWSDPGGESSRTVWGANVLAFFGVSRMLTSVPTSPTRLRTTGFYRDGRKTYFAWPLWNESLRGATISSLLRMSIGDHCVAPEARGVACVYRSEKQKIGDGANFKWAFSPSERVA